MRTHTSDFKEELKVFGRQIQGKIIYYPSFNLIAENEDNILSESDLQLISEQANYDDPIEINEDDIFSISIIKNGNLLQSLMKEFDFEAKVEFNIGSVVNPQFGLLVNEEYEYLDYGNYIINSKEYNIDTDTWSYVCYDKMLFSMVKYNGIRNAVFPMTIKQYIQKLCEKVGLELSNKNFVNENYYIYDDYYKDKNMTIRDIFDEISKVVGGNLLINDDDKVEVGYIKKKKTLFNFDDYYSKSGNVEIISQTNDKLVATVTTASTWQQIQYKVSNLEMNTDYSFSFDFENTYDSELYQHTWMTIKGGTTNNNLFNDAYYKDDVITFNTGDYTEVRFAFHVTINAPAVINTVTISNVRLEKGTSLLEYDVINDEYLKDTDVRISNKIGPVNSVAIYDSENNNQYIIEDNTLIKQDGLSRITITDNVIALNGNTEEIADNIFDELKGLYYYQNDVTTTGVCYYDFLDLFNIEARGTIYQCLLLNNEITISQGIEEHIFTENFEEKETDTTEYTTSTITNKELSMKSNQQDEKLKNKVEKDGIISAINQSPEEIQIQANKLSLKGKQINLTGDNIRIAGENLDINSNGIVTIWDDGAENLEDVTASYIVKSEYTREYGQEQEIMNMINKLTSLGMNVRYDYDNNVSGSSGYGITFGEINANVFRYPSLRLSYGSDESNFSSCYINHYGLEITDVINGATSTLTSIVGGDITCVSVTQTSKKESKKNFEKLTNAKEILNATDIYKYNFKDENDEDKKSIGFVIGDDFNYSKEITSKDNDGANIYSMVSVLWQVVKEQQEEIKELKEMIKHGKH